MERLRARNAKQGHEERGTAALARLDAVLAEPAAQVLQHTVAHAKAPSIRAVTQPDQLGYGYRSDEWMREIQENKTQLFDAFARESDAKEADRRAIDTAEHRPAALDDDAVPRTQRIILAERYRLSAACRITWASSVGGTWSNVRGPSCRATTCGWPGSRNVRGR